MFVDADNGDTTDLVLTQNVQWSCLATKLNGREFDTGSRDHAHQHSLSVDARQMVKDPLV